MNINVTEVRSEKDIERFLKDTEKVKLFMVDTDVSKVKITKSDLGMPGIIKSCLLGYVELAKTISIEHWYKICEEAIIPLKNFFETREFETIYGRVDYSAFLTYNVKLNIIKDWYTRKNNSFFRSSFSDKSIIRGARKIMVCKSLNDADYNDGCFEIEHGLGMYFGTRIDRWLLDSKIQDSTEKIEDLSDKIHSILGEFNIKSQMSTLEAVNRKFNSNISRLGINTLRAHLNSDRGTEEFRSTMQLLIDYFSSKQLLGQLKCIDKMEEDGRVSVSRPLSGRVYSTLDELRVPTNKYSIVKMSVDRNYIHKIIYSLMDGEDPGDYHRYIASKAFEVPEDEVTDEQRRACKDISFGVCAGERQMGYIRRQLKLRGFDANKSIDRVTDTLKYIDISGVIPEIYKTDLPNDIKQKITSVAHQGMYGIDRELLALDYMFYKHVIIAVRKHFGKNNIRIRLMTQTSSWIAYEIANGEVNNFRDFLKTLAIDIGNKRMSLRIDKIIRG